MIYQLAADLVLVIHLLFLVLVIAGGLLAFHRAYWLSVSSAFDVQFPHRARGTPPPGAPCLNKPAAGRADNFMLQRGRMPA
jgi:hypothetical protein